MVMHLDELHIQNFRCFEEISFKFPPENIAVIVGINGAGKSSILDAIANLIMKLITHITQIQLDDWVESRIETIDENDKIFIKLTDIKYGNKQALLDITISDNRYGSISWNIIKKQKKSIELKSEQIMSPFRYFLTPLSLFSNSPLLSGEGLGEG